jgi:hypothetical protein
MAAVVDKPVGALLQGLYIPYSVDMAVDVRRCKQPSEGFARPGFFEDCRWQCDDQSTYKIDLMLSWGSSLGFGTNRVEHGDNIVGVELFGQRFGGIEEDRG